MQLISNSVGDGGVNNRSDVALVQAILVKTQRSVIRVPLIAPTLAPYLSSYDGVCGPATKDAIRAFQNDVWNKDNQTAPGGTVNLGFQTPLMPMGAKAGLIAPNDATWLKLIEKVPADFADLRVLAGGKTVYVAATANQLQERIAAASALTFEAAFLRKVVTCLSAMHDLYGIAIGVCPKGDRRDFGTQDDLLNQAQHVTNAGPGESNHNFGMAVDLGFKGLRWLRPTGAVVENEGPWLDKLSPGAINAEALQFWQALRTVGTSPRVGLFRGPMDDRPHLQKWDDAGVSMGARLADLLSRSGSMRWSAHYVTPHYRYRSDLGLGGELVELGTASQIWNQQATLTLDVLKRARAAAAGKPPAGAARPLPVTDADVTAMKQQLRDQFDLADTNWRSWTPN